MEALKRGLQPPHPGAHLKEIILPALAEQGVSATDVARRLGIGRQTLYDLIDGRRPVTPDKALRLGKLFGNSPEFWMNLQQAYDLWHARDRIADQLDAIPTLEKAA